MTDPALAIATPLVAGFESFRSTVYCDGGGVLTQGYGCTVHPDGRQVSASDPPITEPEGMAWMLALLVPTMARVRALVRVPISDNAAASLCSFSYNCGTGALANSTLLRLLNEGKASWAADQFRAWIHDARGNVEGGLVRRRDVEKALFLRADSATGPTLSKTETVVLPPPSQKLKDYVSRAETVSADTLMAAELAQLTPTPEPS